VCAGDPVHAGDKALMWGTPAQRGSVNRVYILPLFLSFFRLDFGTVPTSWNIFFFFHFHLHKRNLSY
jgi:hypothetical protein